MSGDDSDAYSADSESYSTDSDQKEEEKEEKDEAAKSDTYSSITESRSKTSKSSHSKSGDSDHSSAASSAKKAAKDLPAKRDDLAPTAGDNRKETPRKQSIVQNDPSEEKEVEDPRRLALIQILTETTTDLGIKNAKLLHGRAFNTPHAPAPHVTWSSSSKPRRRSPDGVNATEFTEMPAVFDMKIKLLANLLHASKKTLAYTGAGLSVAAGIGMSAVGSSRGAGSGTGTGLGMAAEPTLAHIVLTELHNHQLLQKWVQRNHDALPQKAGYPQEHINEIHGSWFDPSNPVIKYSGCLRDDLFEEMERQADEADLVLVLGTSLTGLNADQCITKTARRSMNGDALGAVVISPQRTPQDSNASLRIFGKADEVMVALARHLGFGLESFQRASGMQRSADRFPKQNRVLVPYDHNGMRSTTVQSYWDLSPGQRVRISSYNNLEGACQSSDKCITGSTIGIVTGRDELSCSIVINFRGTSKRLGLWWLDTARRGSVACLPLVNVHAKEFLV